MLSNESSCKSRFTRVLSLIGFARACFIWRTWWISSLMLNPKYTFSFYCLAVVRTDIFCSNSKLLLVQKASSRVFNTNYLLLSTFHFLVTIILKD